MKLKQNSHEHGLHYWQTLFVVSVMLFLNACSTNTSPDSQSSAEPDTFVEDILVGSSLDRASATVLDGSVITGKTYIFMADTRGIAQVALYLDKDEGSVSQEPYSTIKYDGLETSVAADYIDTEIFQDGIHVLTADIQKLDGSTKQVNATFLVDNKSELADKLLVSSSSSRRDAVLLGSRVLSGNSYIFVVPKDKTRQVLFYFNDPQRKNRPKQVERIAQYDFAGTANNGSAQAFNTRGQSNGRYSVTAEIWSASGRAKVVTQSFSIDNSSNAPQPQEPSTTPGNLPLDLTGTAPQQKSVKVNVTKPNNAKKATITLGVFGANRYGEGALYINGKGFVRLFGRNASKDFYRKSTKISFDTSADLWRNGQNELLFKHVFAEGYKIESIDVRFDGGGTQSPTPSPTPTPPAPTPTSPSPNTGSYQLRGNPNFSVSSLSAEEQKWYSWLWQAIDNPRPIPDATALAKSGDVFTYRGILQAYVHALLAAFRVTGDLRLLDEVDRLGQLMRSKLSDTNGDGYLNWIDKWSSASKFRGKDTNMAFDLKAHALVAEIAWALHNNRDLRSPSGRNYGANADYWKNYLVNHFEAKWRKRNGISSGFPFAQHIGFHTMHSFMKWHYYMGKLTGKGAYTREAERMANVFWQQEFKSVSSKYGTAVVWSRGLLSAGGQEKYLMPQDYARFVVQEAVDLHFEGFSHYKSNSNMKKFANTLTGFVISDSTYRSFSRDVGGGVSRAGIPASATNWPKMVQTRFAESSWAFLANWDSSGKAAAAATKVFNDVEYMRYNPPPRRVFIPAAMFVRERLN